MPTNTENVCLSGKSGSDANIAKPTRLTQSRIGQVAKAGPVSIRDVFLSVGATASLIDYFLTL